MTNPTVCVLAVLALVAVVGLHQPGGGLGASGPVPPVDGTALLDHIKELASDRYEGRAPGSRGEELTVAYLEAQFRKAGLRPGNPDGTFVQDVPLVGITPSPKADLTLARGSDRRVLKFHDDIVPWTKRVAERVSVADSELVFAGYGIEAPEFNWDDFKGVDVKGKTLVVLINDPPVPDAANPAELDPKVFGGKAMTYYGRWTYKYETGARLGAAAVLIVHETGPAAYPFSVVQNNAGEKFDLVTPDKNMSRAAVEAWISIDAARQLFQMAGQDYDALKARAATRQFTPVPLGVTASITLDNTLRTVRSRNVIAKLEGSDPGLAREHVIFTAHWDHLGVGEPVNGDAIYNGASDNASGTAALLEIARVLAKASPAPKRSILFLAVTAEEQGLLGAAHYAASPLYPLEQTLAVINMDSMNMWGRTRDVTVIGFGASTLDDDLQDAAAAQQRRVRPDPEPEKGSYYRSDHFEFAKQGVPALYPKSGIEYVGRPENFGMTMRDRYTREDYHRPSDEVKTDWQLDGAVEDANLLATIGYRVANADRWPEWRPGNEFRAVREARLEKARRR